MPQKSPTQNPNHGTSVMPKKRINSRTKGKVGELEFAKELASTLGVEARRGVQFQGGPGSPDIVTNIPGVHFECKRTEMFNLYKAMDQAEKDASGKVPVVLHRKNRRKTVVIVYLDDLNRFLRNVLNSSKRTNNG